MSRRRRAVLLIGLALVLGALAASSVARREAALERSVGPLARVLVARGELAAGHRVAPRDLALRNVPARYLPPDALRDARLALQRELAVPVPAGAYVTAGQLARPKAPSSGPRVGPGERAAQVLAVAPPELVAPGARVDVLVTRERGDGGGETELALQDVEVLAAAPAPDAERPASSAAGRVSADLRVRLEDAVALAAAQTFAAEIRLLPRAPGDRRRASALRSSGARP